MIRVIRHHASAGVLPLLASEIVVLFACFYAAAELLYPPSAWTYLFIEGNISLVAVAVINIVFFLYLFDMYVNVQITSRVVLVQKLCQALGLSILAQTVATYLLRDWTVSPSLMLFACGFALAGLFGWRLLFSGLFQRIGPIYKLLFLGRNATAEAVAAAVASDPRAGYKVIGFLDEDTSRDDVLGGFASLREMVAEHKPSLLVVGLNERRASMPIGDLVALRFGGLRIEEASRTFESVYQRVRLSDLSEQEVMFSRAFTPSPGALGMARFENVVLAVLLFVMTLPVFVFMALWLRVSGAGPVLERLPRIGQDGKPFSMFRFRYSPPLGMLYRQFRLAALPQLINVLRGEMSLVGPFAEDPEMARLLDETLPFHHYRTAVPPGITGWAKIHISPEHRNDFALALEYELYYIKHLSLALNLYILVHSLKNRVLRA